ncbi:pilus assembly protein Flp/PilA [Pseudaminobacter salicylatoxidans]|uniref:Pilus assembly protein Flp/PilA n=1 Tax=Pseudaminobacter salicylatoxidans TaxID=93369 RepID=A0A316C011_PSESE|nr:Flp family type IVb pilin [Pseudaminobacter salicylatoxidans]PWJ80934.1 pilus assembly protein Flp/PilA [Pseudaminobacter salicylatoxidans]
MKNIFARFMKDESGATAIEYGLIAALIAVVIIGAAGAIGTNLSDKFQGIADEISTAGTGS